MKQITDRFLTAHKIRRILI